MRVVPQINKDMISRDWVIGQEINTKTSSTNETGTAKEK